MNNQEGVIAASILAGVIALVGCTIVCSRYCVSRNNRRRIGVGNVNLPRNRAAEGRGVVTAEQIEMIENDRALYDGSIRAISSYYQAIDSYTREEGNNNPQLETALQAKNEFEQILTQYLNVTTYSIHPLVQNNLRNLINLVEVLDDSNFMPSLEFRGLLVTRGFAFSEVTVPSVDNEFPPIYDNNEVSAAISSESPPPYSFDDPMDSQNSPGSASAAENLTPRNLNSHAQGGALDRDFRLPPIRATVRRAGSGASSSRISPADSAQFSQV